MTTTTTPQYWLGSDIDLCNLCEKPIYVAFIDGRTKYGPWAIMCTKCHSQHGTGLGIGSGQRYEMQPDGRWLKTK